MISYMSKAKSLLLMSCKYKDERVQRNVLINWKTNLGKTQMRSKCLLTSKAFYSTKSVYNVFCIWFPPSPLKPIGVNGYILFAEVWRKSQPWSQDSWASNISLSARVSCVNFKTRANSGALISNRKEIDEISTVRFACICHMYVFFPSSALPIQGKIRTL